VKKFLIPILVFILTFLLVADIFSLKLVLGIYLLAAVFVGIKFLVEIRASKNQEE